MNSIKSLLGTDHGLLGVLLVVGATVFVVVGRMDVGAWTTFVQWIFGIFVGGHSVMAVGTAIAGGGDAKPDAPATPSPVAKTIATVLVLFGVAFASSAMLTACSASQQAKETAIENGVIDCGKAQVSLDTLGDALAAASGSNAQADLEALAVKRGEAVAACAVQDILAVLSFKAPTAKPSTGEPAPNPTRDAAAAFVAHKGYKFR